MMNNYWSGKGEKLWFKKEVKYFLQFLRCVPNFHFVTFRPFKVMFTGPIFHQWWCLDGQSSTIRVYTILIKQSKSFQPKNIIVYVRCRSIHPLLSITFSNTQPTESNWENSLSCKLNLGSSTYQNGHISCIILLFLVLCRFLYNLFLQEWNKIVL